MLCGRRGMRIIFLCFFFFLFIFARLFPRFASPVTHRSFLLLYIFYMFYLMLKKNNT